MTGDQTKSARHQHPPVDVVIPVFNEELSVVQTTVDSVRSSFDPAVNLTIIVVDDGSEPAYNLEDLRQDAGIMLVRHELNRGYGAALKTGILSGSAPMVAITDADGTYPVERLPQLVDEMIDADMVVGIRTGEISEIPLLRRLPKQLFNYLASYISGTRIRDLNSGMRVFSRELCNQYWGVLPSGFSFVSTMTMGATLGGYRIRDLPINYYKRTGKSSIRPFRDTINFLHIILQMGTLFRPMKIFGPVALGIFAVGALKGFLWDFVENGYIGNLSIMLMLVGIQVVLVGYIGELIVKSRTLAQKTPIGELPESE